MKQIGIISSIDINSPKLNKLKFFFEEEFGSQVITFEKDIKENKKLFKSNNHREVR